MSKIEHHSTASLESRFVEAGGVRTHYVEAGSGPSVILIHGGGAGADCRGNWGSIVPRLADKYRVLAVDMVGFGDTEKPPVGNELYTQKGRNLWLADFVRKTCDGPCVLVGNSMGGATALGVAMAAPALVKRLVLMGSAGVRTGLPPSPGLAAVTGYDFTYDGMRRLIKALTGPGFEVPEEMVRYRYELVTRPDNREGLGHVQVATRASGGLAYTDEAISAVKTPTLLMWGRDDQVLPPANAFRFLELLENSWAYVSPRCGHWLMIEKPDEFVGMLELFLRNHEQT